MQGEAYLAVQYIGNLPEKRDNIVHNSGRVWKGKFSSVRVPASDSDKYLRHADEFRLLHPIFLESDHAAILSADEQLDSLLSIVSNLELHAAEEVLFAAHERVNAIKQRPATTNVTREDRARFTERRAKIAQVVEALDKANPEHFTTTGKPRVSVVQALTELPDVSGAEIEEVLRLMKVAEAA